MNKSFPIPFLIDFDGVINLYGKPAPHAKEFLEFLEDSQIPSFILSNSTLKTSRDVKDFLRVHNLPFNIPTMTAADATLKYVEKNYEKVLVYCADNVKKEFENFIDYDNPQAVVVSDMVDGWSIKILNEIFLKVHKGADIVAMHMNRYWSPEENKFVLDAGSFITAIEYATEKKSILIAKPSPIYFQTALEMIGYSKKSSFMMIGDDIESDIIPTQKLGGRAILILTGKTKLPLPPGLNLKPDFIVNDLSEVIGVLKKYYSFE
jgi:HAD superfamily hydrolase (TIGR01458 family)